MRTESLTRPALPQWRIGAVRTADWLVAAAIASSSIVFSEPAIADISMLAMIVLLPALGVLRFGAMTLINVTIWLIVAVLGVAATAASTTFDTAIVHQLVTLFLVLGAAVLAGYVAADPERRCRLIGWFYVAACGVATAAAIAGWFDIVPGAADLFTIYGRARGTFKDPNVYGAALVPALTFVVWIVLREPLPRARIAGLVAVPLAIGLLISFSRGAWMAAALSIAIVVWIGFVRGRRRSDVTRLVFFGLVGTLGLITVLSTALQVQSVQALFEQRANLDQSYDYGPDGRFGGQQKARRLILEHPFGIGTHTFRDRYHHEEAHNVYLGMFLNAGWLGGLLYIVTVLLTLVVGLRRALRNGVKQGALIVSVAAFAGLAVEGFVIDTDHWRHMFIVMALVWGLIDANPPALDSTRRRTD